MARAPCCKEMGLKKGPWTPEEDQVLISYIQRYGHGNWRALPKQAGLLRCGKSCRLRWINYLRPDIKRGNFSNEEDETIIKLHQILGNRWSAIAAQLPGRTDNEIKNYWHTHLKKKLEQNHFTKTPKWAMSDSARLPPTMNFTTHQNIPGTAPQEYLDQSSDQEKLSSMATMEATNDFNNKNDMAFWYDLFIKSETQEKCMDIQDSLGR